MAIPTWEDLVRPVLELAAKESISRRTATAHIRETVPMTEEEREARIKSGANKVANRAGWAMSHLTKAGFIEKIEKATYRATKKGTDFLITHQGPITKNVLEEVEGFRAAWDSASQKRKEAKKEIEDDAGSTSKVTPEESIDYAIDQIEEELISNLLGQLATVDPYRFEQVVLDVLFAMGYGGSRQEAAQVTQKSNDEGIDGIINEDRLGLDVIYVQAKRWQSTIGRKEIQSFVGALAGKQANKGVFITTSGFKDTATEYAKNVPQKVILINGERLAALMIEHDVGVSSERVIKLKKIDTDYFEDN